MDRAQQLAKWKAARSQKNKTGQEPFKKMATQKAKDLRLLKEKQLTQKKTVKKTTKVDDQRLPAQKENTETVTEPVPDTTVIPASPQFEVFSSRRLSGARRISEGRRLSAASTGSTRGGALRRLGLGGGGAARRISDADRRISSGSVGSTASTGDWRSPAPSFEKKSVFAKMRARRTSSSSQPGAGAEEPAAPKSDQKPVSSGNKKVGTSSMSRARRLGGGASRAAAFVASATSIPAVVTSIATKAQDTDVAKTSREWQLSDFNIGRALGKGKFGNVYLASQKQTACSSFKIALKCLFKKGIMQQPGCVQLLQREVRCLAMCVFI